MNSSKQSDRGLAEDLELLGIRADVASGLIPANPFEERLLTLVAHGLRRLQYLHALEQALFETSTPYDLLDDTDRLKTIRSMVNHAERSLQRSIDTFYRAQRNRKADAKVPSANVEAPNPRTAHKPATPAHPTIEMTATPLMAACATTSEPCVPMPDH